MTQQALKLTDLPAEIGKKIEQFKVDARKEIDAVDAEILKKQAILFDIQKSVCLDDAAALIEANFRRELENKRAVIQKEAASAIYFKFHAPTTSVYLNSGGEVRLEHREKATLNIFGYHSTALDILSVLWSDDEIKEFAKKSAIAAGAKPVPDGRTIEEIERLSAVLVEELEALYTARQTASKTISGLIDIALVPFIAKTTSSAPPEPNPEPSVRTRDKDGGWVAL